MNFKFEKLKKYNLLISDFLLLYFRLIIKFRKLLFSYISE